MAHTFPTKVSNSSILCRIFAAEAAKELETL